MQNLTLSQFIAESGLNASLVRSTVRQCCGWQSFKEMAQDVANHGAGGGYGHFIYYADTIAFTQRNKKALLELCKEQAEDFYGIDRDTCGFIAKFRCIETLSPNVYSDVAQAIYAGKGGLVAEVYNALAWYALEEVARRYCDIIESNE